MTSQERIKILLDHKEADRIGKLDHYWWQAINDFKAQGMPQDIEIDDFFDYDIRNLSINTSLQLPTKTIEETSEYTISSNSWGAVERYWKHQQSTPELIAFSCDTREKWENRYKALKQPDVSRLDLSRTKAEYKKWREQGKFICLSVLEAFEATWRICGPEVQLENLALDPEWILDMYKADTDLIIWAFEELWAEGFEFDGIWLWGDVAYKNGPLISPSMYRELLMPFHKRISDAIHSKGGKLIYHGCGNNNLLMPAFVEAGIDCLQPLEVKAGMDVRELKSQYGSVMSFMGNIDARLFQSNNLEGLEKEIREKVSIAKVGGGYIFHSDHSIPPGTEFKTYQYAMELVEKFGSY
ncbi:MAG TPA: uroporphyrinogen decarboxylase family protein [Armatimonadota bacterium]|nr:uroporphyrinogen decarboxylase family protein [Armatimonadota bacterium]